MKMTDIVAQYIVGMLNAYNGEVDIQRNELANALGCVPSQINYVLSSRFTQEQGYIVESRRGGGGYIRISRMHSDADIAIMHVINAIGTEIDNKSANAILDNLEAVDLLSPKEKNIMTAALSERVFIAVPKEYRDVLRAAILKNMLLAYNK